MALILSAPLSDFTMDCDDMILDVIYNGIKLDNSHEIITGNALHTVHEPTMNGSAISFSTVCLDKPSAVTMASGHGNDSAVLRLSTPGGGCSANLGRMSFPNGSLEVKRNIPNVSTSTDYGSSQSYANQSSHFATEANNTHTILSEFILNDSTRNAPPQAIAAARNVNSGSTTTTSSMFPTLLASVSSPTPVISIGNSMSSVGQVLHVNSSPPISLMNYSVQSEISRQAAISNGLDSFTSNKQFSTISEQFSTASEQFSTISEQLFTSRAGHVIHGTGHMLNDSTANTVADSSLSLSIIMSSGAGNGFKSSVLCSPDSTKDMLRERDITSRSKLLQRNGVKIKNHQGSRCKVCGDVASGKYFGALVCVPCKTFFLRYAGESFSYECKYSKDCSVSAATRTHCKYCRYQKCLQAGMCRKERPDVVDSAAGRQLCAVCQDYGNGIHFGAVTCEGCKKFFRRGMKEYETYSCKFSNNCAITPRTRNFCRYCRYQKCRRVGMSRDAIQMGRPSKMLIESSRMANARVNPSDEDQYESDNVEMFHYFGFEENRRQGSEDVLNLSPILPRASSSPKMGNSNIRTDEKQSSVLGNLTTSNRDAVGAGNINAAISTEDHSFLMNLNNQTDVSEALQQLKNSAIMDELINNASQAGGVHLDPVEADSVEVMREIGSIPPQAGQPSLPLVSESVYREADVCSHGMCQAASADVPIRRQSCGDPSVASFRMRWKFIERTQSEGDAVCGKESAATALSTNCQTVSEKWRDVGISEESGYDTSSPTCASVLINNLISVSALYNESDSVDTCRSNTLTDVQKMITSAEHVCVEAEKNATDELTHADILEQTRKELETDPCGSPTISSSGHWAMSPLADMRHAYESLCELSPEDVDANLAQLEEEVEGESYRMSPEDIEKIKMTKRYWLQPDLPALGLNQVLGLNQSTEYFDIIYSIVPAYSRFVRVGTNLNKTLRIEYRKVFGTSERIVKGYSCEDRSNWIRDKVVTVYTLLSIAYFRSLPGFKDLNERDKMRMLVYFQSPSRILVAALHWYDPEKNDFRDFLSWRGSSSGHCDQFKEMLIRYSKVVQKLSLDSTEAALLNALTVIATDLDGLKNPEIVETTRKKIISTLQAYISERHGKYSNRLQALFRCIPEAKRLGFLHYQMTKTKRLTAEEVTGSVPQLL